MSKSLLKTNMQICIKRDMQQQHIFFYICYDKTQPRPSFPAISFYKSVVFLSCLGSLIRAHASLKISCFVLHK